MFIQLHPGVSMKSDLNRIAVYHLCQHFINIIYIFIYIFNIILLFVENKICHLYYKLFVKRFPGYLDNFVNVQ